MTAGAKYRPPDAIQHRTAGPYSPVLEVDARRLVVISGQVAVDMEGKIVGTTIEEQAEATLANCARLLASAGCTLLDVFKHLFSSLRHILSKDPAESFLSLGFCCVLLDLAGCRKHCPLICELAVEGLRRVVEDPLLADLNASLAGDLSLSGGAKLDVESLGIDFRFSLRRGATLYIKELARRLAVTRFDRLGRDDLAPHIGDGDRLLRLVRGLLVVKIGVEEAKNEHDRKADGDDPATAGFFDEVTSGSNRHGEIPEP